MTEKEKINININYFELLIFLIAIILMSVGVFAITTNMYAKVHNREVIYFNGGYSFYNPVTSKKALIIQDANRPEIGMDCKGENNANGYTVTLYSVSTTRVTIRNRFSNDEYRTIYGVDHPCY